MTLIEKLDNCEHVLLYQKIEDIDEFCEAHGLNMVWDNTREIFLIKGKEKALEMSLESVKTYTMEFIQHHILFYFLECERMIFYDKVEMISDFCAEYDLVMAWDIEKDKFKITDGYDDLYLTHDYILNKRIDGIKRHILTYFDIYG